jgi:serine acetyltransferase
MNKLPTLYQKFRDACTLEANLVVIRSVKEQNILVAGRPVKIIKKEVA